jgi:hypothetical protein
VIPWCTQGMAEARRQVTPTLAVLEEEYRAQGPSTLLASSRQKRTVSYLVVSSTWLVAIVSTGTTRFEERYKPCILASSEHTRVLRTKAEVVRQG